MFSIFSISRPVLRPLCFTTGRGFAQKLAVATKKGNGERFTQKLNEVDNILKSTGRVPTRDFLEGLKEMMQPETKVSPIQGLLMLRCCGSLLQEETQERRNELAEQTWAALIDRGVRLDISHYNALLRIYLENSKKFDPLRFLEDLESKNIQPNRVTYQRIIHHFCANKQMETAAKLLLILKEKNIPLTDTIFNSLLMGHIRTGDFEGYESTIRMMSDFQLEPTDETYTVILSTAAKMSSSDPRFDQLFNDTLKKIQKEKFHLSDQKILEIATHVPESNESLFDQIISMCDRGSDYNTNCYNAILELINQGKSNFALRLLRTMNSGNSPLFQSGHFVIKQMVKVGNDPTKVKQVCDQLKKEGLSDYALSVAVENAFEHCDLETSRIYLKDFIEQSSEKVGRPHYYWPLLSKCTSESQVLDVLLKDMTSMDKLCPARTMLETFEEFVWTKKVRDPLLFLEKLKPAEYPTSLILTSLVNYYVQNHELDQAIGALNKNSNIFLHPRFVAPNLAASFAKQGEVSEFVSLFKKLQEMSSDPQDEEWIGRCILQYIREGGHKRIPVQDIISAMARSRITIPRGVLDMIQERNVLEREELEMLASSDTFSYTKPRDSEAMGDIEALENHLIELKSRGLDTRGCQRRLILAYCRKQGSDNSGSVLRRVEELLHDLKSQGFFISNAMNASLMDLYANNDEIEKAMELKKIIQSEFVIDPFKIINLACALIRKGKRDEAMALIVEQLQVEKDKKAEQSGQAVERNIFKLLNTAAETTRDSKFVEELLQVALQLVNVNKPTNVMIGPLVKVHLLNDDLKSALDEFAHAASKYKLAPWRGELMKRVIEKDDPVSLQLITDITVKMFGEAIALVDVAKAFIEAGKPQQAKKVVEHPSFVQADRAIFNVAERYVIMNQIEHLEKFVDLVSNVRDKIDLEPLFFQLIRGYTSRNDPQKALDVWTTMQEKEVLPSAKTLKYLGSFLEESGVIVPFDYSNLEETAQKQDKTSKRSKMRDDSSDVNVLSGNIDEILEQRKQLEKQGKSFSVSMEGNLITRLMSSERFDEAIEIFKSLIHKGSFPVPRVLRHVIGILNKKGDVQAMEEIRGNLPEQFKNQSWYTNQFAYCYINAKQEDKFVKDILPSLNPVPLSAVLNILRSHPEFEPQVLDLADKALKEQNFSLVHNIVWTHRMLSHRFEEARQLLESIPNLKDSLLFQAVINHIRLEKDLELADALATMIEDTNMLGRKLAEVHSAKIDALIEMEEVEQAEKHLIRVIAEAKTKTSKLKLEDMKRMTLVRLRQKLIELYGREPQFQVPQQINKSREDSDKKQRVAVDSI